MSRVFLCWRQFAIFLNLSWQGTHYKADGAIFYSLEQDLCRDQQELEHRLDEELDEEQELENSLELAYKDQELEHSLELTYKDQGLEHNLELAYKE